jgi:Fic family protein
MQLHFKEIYNLVWEQYEPTFPNDVDNQLQTIANKIPQITKDSFGFYTSIASVYSSKIEGVDIELDSFIKHKFLNVSYLPNYTAKPDDLFAAYLFAKENILTEQNLLVVHTLVTKHLLVQEKRGKVRTKQMFVLDNNSNIEYIAANANDVKAAFENLVSDIEVLTKEKLTLEQIIFYASMIHLLFVKIHPLYDGNGRTGRLLEKWFLATHLGAGAWNIESERYYYENIKQYYFNLRVLGLEYEHLNYSKALPFTQMLIKSLY